VPYYVMLDLESMLDVAWRIFVLASPSSLGTPNSHPLYQSPQIALLTLMATQPVFETFFVFS
jgi:hypothetical protein